LEEASDSGVNEGVVSERTLENRRRRQVRKERKQAKQAGMNRTDWRKADKEYLSGGVSKSSAAVVENTAVDKSELRLSLERKWAAENAVAEEKAKQELEIVKRRDVEKEVKKREAAVMKKTECNRVAVEKAFSTLKATGNVPGFCETVVSNGSVPALSSGSISPNSSVSEREVRNMIMELERLKVEMERLKAENARLRMVQGVDRFKRLEDGETVAFSADNFSVDCKDIVDEMCEDGYVAHYHPEDEETVYVRADGLTKGYDAVAWQKVCERNGLKC